MILPLKSAIPSAQSLYEVVKRTKIDAAFVVPLIIEEMSRSSELLDYISQRVDTVVYTGGDVPQECGDAVAKHIPLVNFYGSTEGASLALIHPEGDLSREEWKFLSLHPKAGVEFKHHIEDIYELFIVRHSELESHQQIFKTFPELNEFRTRDLFKRHPTKENLWNHCGRADDILVFLTGEKVNPIKMEQQIFSRNPEISGVLVAGSQRFQTALLIELVQSEEISSYTKADLIGKFWPSIEEVNMICPGHARIAKTHIVFVDPNRPMSRSPKGTVQRAATVAEYKDILEELYRNADNVADIESSVQRVNVQDTASALQYLQTLFNRVTGRSLAVEDNFFVQGVDSLQTLLLVREMRQMLALPKIEMGTLYAHPTLTSLVDALQRGSESQSLTTQSIESAPDAVHIAPTIEYFCGLVEEIPIRTKLSSNQQTALVYLVTGSTGSLGCYILDSLMKSGVTHIYCLNRVPNSGAAQRKKSAAHCLSTEFLDSKVTHLTADLSDPTLGLEQKTYNILLDSVTHIVHNAWSVDFNVPLSSYRSQLQGLVNLIKFCTLALPMPSFLFISSISSVSRLNRDSVPEAIVDDHSAPGPTGYGASKYIAEHLLDFAARRLLIRARIARIGQIAGPRNGLGQWNRSEWLPSLIRSSFTIKAIPESLGEALDRVDWLPIDELAPILLELAEDTKEDPDVDQSQISSKSSEGAIVFNVLNPKSRVWHELLPVVKTTFLALETSKEIPAVQRVSFDKWLVMVRNIFETQSKAHGKTEKDLESILKVNPAVKLLGFYEEEQAQRPQLWETGKTRKTSATLASLSEIDDNSMQKWIRGWLE